MIQYSSFQQTVWWYLLTFLAAAIGSGGSLGSSKFYRNFLKRPWWAPPSWLFPVVWTILYALQAQSSYFIQVSLGGSWGFQLSVFLSFLIISTFWTFVFFRYKRLGASVIVILVSFVLAVLTTIFYFREDSLSGWLFLPTTVWVGFASLLNISIWRLNSSRPEIQQYHSPQQYYINQHLEYNKKAFSLPTSTFNSDTEFNV
jgi:tryptophan-rich sensory protein